VQRHGIGRQLQPPSSGSTHHDRVTVPQICPLRSPTLDRPRHGALRYRPVVANRRTIHAVRPQPPLIRLPFHRNTTRCKGSIQIGQLARGNQIPIAPATPPHVPCPRFPPLEAFGRRPPNTRLRPSSGRHPKPFTPTSAPQKATVRLSAARKLDVAFPPSSISLPTAEGIPSWRLSGRNFHQGAVARGVLLSAA
jgi:hypothetical protein